jgi:flagellar basal-body rod modification protein FlgD
VTFVDPISAGTTVSTMTTGDAPAEARTNQFDQDTFLRLLVAQLKYQNPLAPADGTEFLSQTAQFTQLETLQKIEKLITVQSAASEVLEASAMVGRQVQIALPPGQQGRPIATTNLGAGGNLTSGAAPGAKVESTIEVLANDGTKVPLRLQLTRLPDTGDVAGETRWELRTFVSTTQISGPTVVTFDAQGERTSPDPVVSAAQLNEIPSARGKWDPNGITVGFGRAGDPARLRVGTGPSSFGVREHNGSDGTSISGIVTGVRFTIDGPLLKIGDRELPLSNVMEVHVAAF